MTRYNNIIMIRYKGFCAVNQKHLVSREKRGMKKYQNSSDVTFERPNTVVGYYHIGWNRLARLWPRRTPGRADARHRVVSRSVFNI